MSIQFKTMLGSNPVCPHCGCSTLYHGMQTVDKVVRGEVVQRAGDEVKYCMHASCRSYMKHPDTVARVYNTPWIIVRCIIFFLFVWLVYQSITHRPQENGRTNRQEIREEEVTRKESHEKNGASQRVGTADRQ